MPLPHCHSLASASSDDLSEYGVTASLGVPVARGDLVLMSSRVCLAGEPEIGEQEDTPDQPLLTRMPTW